MLEINKITTVYFNNYDVWEKLLIDYFFISEPDRINKYAVSKRELCEILSDTTMNEAFAELLLQSENLSQNDLDDIVKIDVDFINFEYWN